MLQRQKISKNSKGYWYKINKNSGPLKTACILIAFIPTDRQQREKLLRDHRDIPTTWTCFLWAFIPDYLNSQMGVDGKRGGELEWKRWKRSTGGEVQLDLWKVSYPWDCFEEVLRVHKYLHMQQPISLSCIGKLSNFTGTASGCGSQGKGKSLSWWTRDTVCKGRTSAWVEIGLVWREEVNLEAFLNEGRMSWIPPVSAMVGAGKKQVLQMLCPSEQQPEPSTSEAEENSKVRRKMAMLSLGADNSGSVKWVCLSVCTETGLNPPQLLSQAPGKGGAWAPGESLSVLADETSSQDTRSSRGVGMGSPCPLWWQEPGGVHGPAAAASPVPASLPGLAASLSF